MMVMAMHSIDDFVFVLHALCHMVYVKCYMVNVSSGSFRNLRAPYVGVLLIRILLSRVLC